MKQSSIPVIWMTSSSLMIRPTQLQPENMEVVKQIRRLYFQPTRRLKQPADLVVDEDGSVEAKLKKDQRRHFETASSTFLAYLRLSFWRIVVRESNEYAGAQKGAQTSLKEILKFLGIMFYMTVVDKGEYSNYWGEQLESSIT